jgi:hypothetical protein
MGNAPVVFSNGLLSFESLLTFSTLGLELLLTVVIEVTCGGGMYIDGGGISMFFGCWYIVGGVLPIKSFEGYGALLTGGMRSALEIEVSMVNLIHQS